MNPSARFVFFGAINACLAVALGAFGKHALASSLTPSLLETWRTAAHYHLIHALALILVGLWLERAPQPQRAIKAGWLLLAGMVIFAGSLYTLVLTGITPLGAITPLGGGCFLLGWLYLAGSAR